MDTECEEAGTAEGLHGSQGTGLSSASLTAAALKQPRDDCSSQLACSAETREAAKHPAMHRAAPQQRRTWPMSQQAAIPKQSLSADGLGILSHSE